MENKDGKKKISEGKLRKKKQLHPFHLLFKPESRQVVQPVAFGASSQ